MNNPLHLLDLPEEILLDILDYLPYPCILKFALSSRYCYYLSKYWNPNHLYFFLATPRTDIDIEKTVWEPSIPEPRVCQASIIHEGKLFMHGGHNTPFGSQNFGQVFFTFSFFDLEKKCWFSSVSNSLKSRTEHTACLWKRSMLIFGGYSGSSFCNDILLGSLDTGEVIPYPSAGTIPSSRSAHIAGVWDRWMYVFGGWNGSHQFNDMYRLDLETFQWEQINWNEIDAPVPRCSHAGVVVPKYNSWFVFSGYSGPTRGYNGDLWRFDFVSNSWECLISTSNSIFAPRSRMRMTYINQFLLIMGGWNQQTHFPEILIYDIERKTMTKTSFTFSDNFSGKIAQHTMLISGDKLVLFGGFSDDIQKASNNLYICKLPKKFL